MPTKPTTAVVPPVTFASASITVNFRKVIQTKPYETETFEFGVVDTVTVREGARRLSDIAAAERQVMEMLIVLTDTVIANRRHPQATDVPGETSENVFPDLPSSR